MALTERNGSVGLAGAGELEAGAAGSLVFPGDKSHSGHVEGCISAGAAFVWEDGRTAPLRSKASNRCHACARAVAYENMTMLRQDAEDNSAPEHVLTLTSRDWFTGRGDKLTAKAYTRACATFWQAFRRRWGAVEYCGFIEWTTGEAPRSGGKRRMHSHWLVKGLDAELELEAVQAWVSAEWCKLTGAWKVELAALETIGGVVGYLALHHEKATQAPPDGWTGRRLRPSKGYFATDGRLRRERARAWLTWYRLRDESEGAQLNAAASSSPRVVFRSTERELQEDELAGGPVQRGYFLTLPAQRALDAQLLRAASARASEDELEYWERRYREMVTTAALRCRAVRRLRRSAS